MASPVLLVAFCLFFFPPISAAAKSGIRRAIVTKTGSIELEVSVDGISPIELQPAHANASNTTTSIVRRIETTTTSAPNASNTAHVTHSDENLTPTINLTTAAPATTAEKVSQAPPSTNDTNVTVPSPAPASPTNASVPPPVPANTTNVSVPYPAPAHTTNASAPSPGTLCVKIDNATNIPDHDSFGAAKSDAFVKVKVGSQEQKTGHIDDKLSPTWNWESTPCFHVNKTVATVVLSLWDFDKWLNFQWDGHDHIQTEDINFRREAGRGGEWTSFVKDIAGGGKLYFQLQFTAKVSRAAQKSLTRW